PAHHSPFCSLLYTTKEGQDCCSKCDKARIKQIKDGKTVEPYECDAGLIDFCEPIYCKIGGKQRLIGVFFAGQVLYEEDKITNETIRKLKEVSTDCKVDTDELLARYMQVRRLPHERVDEIRTWMKQFSHLLGLMVERKATNQQLLLDVIDSADDPNAIVQAIQRHLHPGAVSIFLQRDDVPDKYKDRIFLIATAFKPLVGRLALEVEENNIEKIAYRSGEGFTGSVFKTGKVLHVPDVWNEDCYPEYPNLSIWQHKIQEVSELDNTKAFLGVPIRGDNSKIIGVIRAVRLKDDPGFKNEEIELLTGIASLVEAAVTKAKLYKEHVEKVEALNQAQGLLNTLTEPETNLESITNSMVQQLGKTYVKKGKWKAVYVLKHLKSSRQFQFVASFPANLADKYKGAPFPDKEGVAGHVLTTGKFFASRNCIKDGVTPTTPWTSVICAPIIHEGEMWGAVSLCCRRELSQNDIDSASLKITEFAENMSLVCRLSEILDAKNKVALAASNLLSLNLEAHEVYKSLESSKLTVELLCRIIQGEQKQIVEDLAKEINDSLSWADVCLELGRYVKLCQKTPDFAIKVFRAKHLPKNEKAEMNHVSEDVWEQVDLLEIAEKALVSVEGLGKTHQANITRTFEGPCIVIGDGNLLYRALSNLLENAIVHGSRIKGKEIKYRTGVSVTFSVSPTSHGNLTKIMVQDDGEGMSPETLRASKEIYADPTLLRSTSFAPGFGTIVVAFAVSVHHGCITLESKPREGTLVSIEIPSYRRKDQINEKNSYC
ncbi:MAG: hypothetical protein AMJ75_07430, partial [Phycisphaerae bacterium SM1_79]